MTQRNNPSAVSAYSGNRRCKLITPIMYIFFLLLFNPTVYLPVKYSPAYVLPELADHLDCLSPPLSLPSWCYDTLTSLQITLVLTFFSSSLLTIVSQRRIFFPWQFCIQLLAATYLTITLTEAELLMFNKRTKLLIWILAPELFYF